MHPVNLRELKLSMITSSFANLKDPIHFILVDYFPEDEFELQPKLKIEEHYLIANAVNKFYELVVINDSETGCLYESL